VLRNHRDGVAIGGRRSDSPRRLGANQETTMSNTLGTVRTVARRTIGRALLAAAVTGAGSSAPSLAGVWGSSPSCDAGGACRVPNTGGKPLLGDWDIDFDRTIERIRKSPFEHYSHNPDDLRARPLCPPYCSPQGGYYEPNWRQLPAMPEAVYHDGMSPSMMYSDGPAMPYGEYAPMQTSPYPAVAPPPAPSASPAPAGSSETPMPPVPPAGPDSYEAFPEEPPAGPAGEETFLPPVAPPAAGNDQPYLRLGVGPALPQGDDFH
jgi:hypothetical protein